MKFDLHIHSCLSPCADLSMSPAEIVRQAKARGMDGIALTDHQSARNAPAIAECARRASLGCLFGLEVQTAEEVHTLAIFDTVDAALEMTEWVYAAMPKRVNDPDTFGDQPVVTWDEEIVEMEWRILAMGCRRTIPETAEKVHSLGGIYIAAHIDRPNYSVLSGLGAIPEGVFDAVELSRTAPGDFCGRAIEQSSGRAIEQSSGRAIEQSSGRAIEQSSGRAIEQSSGRAVEQSSNRAIGQSSGRAIGQSSGRAIEQSSGRAIEQSSGRAIEQSSNLQPLTSDLQPLNSDLQPPTFNLQPLTSDLQPLTSNLQPPTFNLQPSPALPLIRSSDAHNPDDVARVWTEADTEFTVAGLKAAFKNRATRISERLTCF